MGGLDDFVYESTQLEYLEAHLKNQHLITPHSCVAQSVHAELHRSENNPTHTHRGQQDEQSKPGDG